MVRLPASGAGSTERFEDYLQKTLRNSDDIKQILKNACEYQDVLKTGNASPLLTLSKDVRRNTMRALAHLAKFNGIQKHWKEIMEQYGLHWKEASDDFDLFSKQNVNEMIQYIRDVTKILPKDCANTFVYATLVGLRAEEVMKSIGLIKQNAEGYHNTDLGILEHFKFKEQFIRRTKKAFISIVNEDIINIARQSCNSYNTIQQFLKRRKTPCKFQYARDVFATYLRDNQIPSEVIDILQGRVPSSIFAKHYYKPDFNQYATKIRDLLIELRAQIT